MDVRHCARGRSCHGHQGHDARASGCRRGRKRLLVLPAAAIKEAFVAYNFSLEILSPIASRIFLPCSFAMIISELELSGLWLQLLGCSRLRFWVKLQVDSCFLVWIDVGWKVFSLCLHLQAGDN